MSNPVSSPPHALTVINYAKGGIGNQLFQETFARSVAARLNARLQTDCSFYQTDPYGFSAAIWNLDPQAETTTVASHLGPGGYILKEGQIRSLQQIKSLPTDAKALVLNGYWQGEDYFDPTIANQVYAGMTTRFAAATDDALQQRLLASKSAVAVHLRRRDYGHMGLCTNEYFIAATEHLLANYPDAELFVFTDEPNYTRHLLTGRNKKFTLVDSGSDLGDLYLMSLCRHFVISNSSFSWWGAWFGEQRHGPETTVICPAEWVTFDATPSPCPARWLRMPGVVSRFAVHDQMVAGYAANLQHQRFNSAVRQWFRDHGDQTKRVEFTDLDDSSLVVDLGGYKGDWTDQISQRYNCNLMVFEPIRSFHQNIINRFQDKPKVKAFQFGLSGSTQSMQMQHAADGTSAFVEGESETVALVEARQFLRKHKVEQIDLMKINIEGGEYELLDHLIESGDISRIRRIQIQFHDFVDDAIRRRSLLRERLQTTHRETWCYYFVWEEWELLEPGN